ncbi:MAG: Gfo/Idh/MocA family oxidoreductase, partial [Phycisphaerae bacterium]|nr:Gfo/Idh/MocA family oxidoreductase [Phycisphaerae bacterium]NIP54353.1 Gfo/Idh/MocA family oxidoreductase [Phycisphaerae bacterium]NIS53220.1 Gfo/Idh/MocA family oxidoreductase [Phycisphaerae bacterium]NIU10707.1 Gfo/Idh/MocA family oxidoreductase [Phycisphaerae bacterium]NIU58474.1 Gfo/Idh/MocA family oxidoreductase [Phycisphaerae bacterium]
MGENALSVAVVGAGYWGKNLIRNFATTARSNLKYVCDLDEKRLAIQKKNFPFIETTKDFHKALSDREVEAVVIATEVPTHFGIAQQSLEAGKHTYVEKPMTSTADESKKLVDLAKEKRVKLMVGHLLEYHPGVNFLKEAI